MEPKDTHEKWENVEPKESIVNQAEQDPFTHNAKSSVKISENTKGINIEVKVVSGEESLMEGIRKEAINQFNLTKKELNEEK